MHNDDQLYDLLPTYRELLARGGDVTPANLGVDADTFAQLVKLQRRSKAIEGLLDPIEMPEVRPGVSTGRYQTNKRIASGGHGDVFRTDDRELGRSVALKVPQILIATPELKDRLKAEALLMGQLDHPGVPAVHSLGTDSTGRPFYTMRLIDGHTLTEEIDRLHKALPSKLTTREFGDRLRPLLRRFVAVCASVAYAHSRGIIHRDLKPDNVMLGAFDETLVMDWGLARSVKTSDAGEKAIDPEKALTGHTVGAIGTIGYIAPEQWAADQSIDHRADVYSLGAILYHVLANRSSLLKAEIGEGFRPEKVRPLSESKSGLPPALVAVYEKAMSADRAARYSSAADLSADVQAWLDDRRVGAYREPWIDGVARWTRRYRTAVSIAATAVPLLIALGVGTWLANYILSKAETRRAAAVADKAQAEQDAETTRTESRQSARRNYPSALEAVDRLIDHGDLDAADKLLDQQRKVLADVNEQPGFEWTHRKAQVASLPPIEFPPFHAGKVVGLCQPDAYSPLLSVAEDGALVRWDPNTQKVIGVSALDLGQKLAMSGFTQQVIDGRRQVTSVDPGMPAALAQPPMEVGDVIHSVGPNQDALTPVDGLTDEAFIKLIPPAIGAQVCFETSKPDGSARRNVTLTRVRRFQQFSQDLNEVNTFSHDGKKLAMMLMRDDKGEWKTNANERKSRVWYPVVVVFDTANGDRLCEIPLPEKVQNMNVSALAFSPDGNELVVGFSSYTPLDMRPKAEASVSGYRVYEAATGKERSRIVWPKSAWNTEGFGPMAYSPDGKRLYGIGLEYFLGKGLGYLPMDKPGAEVVSVTKEATQNVTSTQMKVSDDGRWVLLHGDGGASIVNTLAGVSRPLNELSGAVLTAAFDPRGNLLAAIDTGTQLVVWDLTSLKSLRKFKLLDDSPAGAISFDRSARKVFVAQHRDIAVYSTERNPAERTFGNQEGSKVGGSTFHPSGEFLYASGGIKGESGGAIRRHALAENRPAGVLLRDRSIVELLSVAQVSPDGSQIAIATTNIRAGEVPEVVVYDAKTTKVIHRFSLPPELEGNSTLNWLPGGGQILVGENQSYGENPTKRAQPYPTRSAICDLKTGQIELVSLSDSGAADIAISRDGKSMVVSDDTSVYVRDPRTFMLKYRLRVKQSPALALTISPDSRWFVVVSGINMSQISVSGKRSWVTAFDLETGKLRFNMQAATDGAIPSIDISPDGKLIACGTTSGHIDLLSAVDGKLIRTVQINDTPGAGVTGVCFAAGGQELVATTMVLNGIPVNGNPGTTVARFAVDSGKLIATIEGDALGPQLFRSSLRPNTVNIVDVMNGTVRVYDTANWKTPISTYRHAGPTAVSDVGELKTLTVSADGRRVAGAETDGTVVVYSYPDGKTIRKWKPTDLVVTPEALRFTPYGAGLIVAGFRNKNMPRVGRVVQLDIDTGERKLLVDIPTLGVYSNGVQFGTGLFAMTDDASAVFVVLAGAKPADGEILARFSLTTGEETARHQLPPLAKVTSLTFCSTTSSVYASGHERVENKEALIQAHEELFVWKVGEDTTRAINLHSTRPRPIGHAASSQSGEFRLTVSPDGRLAALRNFGTGTIRVIDIHTGRTVITRAGENGYGPLLFSPDGRTLVNTIGNGRVVSYNSGPEK